MTCVCVCVCVCANYMPCHFTRTYTLGLYSLHPWTKEKDVIGNCLEKEIYDLPKRSRAATETQHGYMAHIQKA